MNVFLKRCQTYQITLQLTHIQL